MKQEMEKRKQGKSEGNEKQKWVHDASLDYKGRVPIRASTEISVGRDSNSYRRLQGNPFMPILQVLIAAIRKRNLLCPSNPASMSENFQGRLLSHTSRLSKKAIKRASCRLRLLKNKRQAIARQLRKDLAKLIQSGHEETAFNRICLLMPHTHLLTTACVTIFFETD
ncbi:Protein NRT1/ PTR FAMILY 5.6 [Glycine soja]